MEASSESLPSHWLLTTVGRVGAIRLGRQRSPANTSGRFATKYVRAANVTNRGLDLADVLEMDFTPDERAIYRLLRGDVLLVEGSGSADQVGRAAIWQDQIPDCCFQNTVIRFRPHAATAQYALIVFRHLRISGVFGQTARGVGILHLGASRFANLQFPLPSLREQARIAEVVDERSYELQEAERSLQSALKRLMEQDLEILAQAADGRLIYPDRNAPAANKDPHVHPDENGGAAPDPRVTQEGASKGSSSAHDDVASYEWARELPGAWTWVRIGDVAELRLGRMRSPEHSHGPNMHPYLRVANVLEDRIDTSDILQMNFSPDQYEVYLLRPGDILLNDGQSPELVGRPAMYRGEVPGACYQNHLIRFRASSAVDPEFALLVFRHYLHARRFREVARWTTNIATLSLKRFSDMPFPLPPLPEQARIVQEARRRLSESESQQAAVRQSLSRLPEMEAELLAMAVSGSLVPPEDTGESAAELLKRLGPAPKEQAADHSSRKPEGARMPQRPTRGHRPLPEVLSRQQVPIPLPELFRLAGFDKDEPADVEEFYVELREELGSSIRPTAQDRENALVEAIDIEAN